MGKTRPVPNVKRTRLIVPAGFLEASGPHLEGLRAAFDIVEADNLDDARTRAGGRRTAGEAETDATRDTLVLWPEGPPPSATVVEGLSPEGVIATLQHIGEGVGLVDARGELTWANARLLASTETTKRCFLETCFGAMERLDQAGAKAVALNARPSRKFAFAADGAHFEVLVSIASVDEADDSRVTSVVGILWEVTEARELQAKIDAIDAAGAELMRIDNAVIEKLNMGERLALLEEKIIRYVRELLDFDKFEVRIIDRETNQLQLVFNRGLTPLRIGESIYAEAEDNGISGYVAAMGEPYICRDIDKDPFYFPGLDGAKSALTVPLRLYDRVIGVFNVESPLPDAFNENDRRFAQIFARYVAMAMHILDLLVVERYTTNEQIAANVLGELTEPLEEITAEAAALRRRLGKRTSSEELDRIIHAAEGIRRRILVCAAGPKSILGAEQVIDRLEPDPLMTGKRVILAENEQGVRDAINGLLTRKGCEVTVCTGGADTIDELRAAHAEGRHFDLVISDVKMPDRNGYEVFRTAKEFSPDTPVILMTGFGYDPHHSIVRATQEGLHSFLFKPLKAGQFLEAVEKALKGAE